MRTLALRKFRMLRIDANISYRAPSVRFVALKWFGWGAFSFKTGLFLINTKLFNVSVSKTIFIIPSLWQLSQFLFHYPTGPTNAQLKGSWKNDCFIYRNVS